MTIASSVGIGLSSVDLLWLIGGPLVREMPPVPRGAEEVVFSPATDRDCSSSSSSSSKRTPVPFCCKDSRSREFVLGSYSIHSVCSVCLPAYFCRRARNTCCLHIGNGISASCMLNFVATSVRFGLTGLDLEVQFGCLCRRFSKSLTAGYLHPS